MIAEHHRLALPTGYQLGKYRFLEVLGAGGFGITYLAEDSSLGRRVAIKELLPNDIATRIDGTTVVAKTRSEESTLDWARERFVEEGRALAACDHPNVVNVYELVEANGTAYMVTKFEEGSSLADWLRDLGRAPDEAELRSIVLPLLSGLEKVHAAGFLHRDIKPENIYLTLDGRPLLLDFGSARQAVTDRTMALTVVVTAGYAPFEQYHEDGKQGAWSDIYALAAVMYRAITGKKPPEATRRLKDDPCVKLAKAHAGAYQAQFLNAIDSALNVEPSKRPQTIAVWRQMMGDGPASSTLTTIRSVATSHRTNGEASTSASTAAATVNGTIVKLQGTLRGIEDRVKNIEQLPAPVRENPLRFLAATGIALLVICWIVWKISRPHPTPHPPVAIVTPAPKPIETPAPATPAPAPGPAPTTPPPLAPAGPTPAPRVILPTPPLSTPPPAEPSQVAQSKGPQPGQPWQNSLGIRFAPVPGSNAHMAVWKTRRSDFDAFVQAAGYNANGGMTSSILKGTKAKGITWQNPGFAQTPDHPVVGVNAYDALAFCQWLTQKELKEGMIPDGAAYRLPTDQEWTAAAGHAAYPWGESWPPPADSVGNFAGNEARTSLGKLGVISHYSDGFVATSPGGSFPANANGFYDIGGNAAEWCGTWYRRDLNSDEVLRKISRLQDDGNGKSQLTIRGSSCFTHAGDLLRLDTRSNEDPTTRSDAVGFRIVLSAKNPDAVDELPRLLAPANGGKKDDGSPGDDSDNAAKVDPRIVGVWETKGVTDGAAWTLRWDQQANGHFVHSKSDTDTGTVTTADGKLRVYSDTSKEWTDETYELLNTTTLVTDGPDGKATWKRIATHTSSTHRRSSSGDSEQSSSGGHVHHSIPNPVREIIRHLPFF